MTATVDFRRSDHEREADSERRRNESLCLSEFMDDILETDAGILDQANDFMHLLPDGDDIGTMGNLHMDPFCAFDGEDIEPVFGALGDNSSLDATEDVVDVESVDSSEEPTLVNGCLDTNESKPSQIDRGCARTMGVMPHHFGEMKLRLRTSVEAASRRRRNLNRIISDDDDDGEEVVSGPLEQPAVIERQDIARSPPHSFPATRGSSTTAGHCSLPPAGVEEKRKTRTRRRRSSSSSHKSLRKRNRNRRILDTPPASPVKWQGAHGTAPVNISPHIEASTVKASESAHPGRADSIGSNDSHCCSSSSSIDSPQSADGNIDDSSGSSNRHNENSNSNRNRDQATKKCGSHDSLSALSDSSNSRNSASACAKMPSSLSSSSESASKLRLDGVLVSPSRQVKPKQKVVPRSLVERLKAAAQKASSRQSILLPVPVSKAAENSLVSLDHDYCFQTKSARAADRDNLEPEPMDVESDGEQSPVRIEVLPDLSLAKRQGGGEAQTALVDASLEYEQLHEQEPVEVILRQPASRSLLKVNQPIPTIVQVVTLQQHEQAIAEAVLSAEPADGAVVLASDQMIWSIDGDLALVSAMDHEEQVLHFVEEEEVVTTTASEGTLSDSGVESLDRRRESRDDASPDDDMADDGSEGRRWKDKRARAFKRTPRRDANNNNKRYGPGSAEACTYRSRRRFRSGSATSNSSLSSSDSGRSRSGSSEARCKCNSSGGASRPRGGGDQQSHHRKRSSSRDGCKRCRCPSPDYSVGSHATRQRALEVTEHEAYAEAGWGLSSSSNTSSGTSGSTNTQIPCPPVSKRERKNIWCMDTPTQPVEPPPALAHKRPQTLTAMQEALEKIRKGGDRKIIYVGKIPEGTTRVQIREWFSRFGKIAEVSLHFRDTGENYGFITFDRAEDAYRAVERGNEDPELPKFQLCFGGRRQFCGQQWSDLDSQLEKDYLREGKEDLVKKDDDFDSLLKSLKGAPLSGARRR